MALAGDCWISDAHRNRTTVLRVPTVMGGLRCDIDSLYHARRHAYFDQREVAFSDSTATLRFDAQSCHLRPNTVPAHWYARLEDEPPARVLDDIRGRFLQASFTRNV